MHTRLSANVRETYSRPVPDYIKRLIAHNRTNKEEKDGATLFKEEDEGFAPTVDEIIPDVRITEAEYRNNPLAADVRYWGSWLQDRIEQELQQSFIADADGKVPVAFLWARLVKCPNPPCKSDHSPGEPVLALQEVNPKNCSAHETGTQRIAS